MHIDWDDLRLVLAIARAGTLSDAAPQLGMSQPTAGRKLRALESSIGSPIFQRTPYGFELTEEGERMRDYAERIEEHVLGLTRELAGSEPGLNGILKVSCVEWFGRQVLAPVVADFSNVHPGVTVELQADPKRADLDRREADLACRFGKFDSPHVLQRKLLTVNYGLYATAAYFKKLGNPTASPDGAGHRLIGMNSIHDNVLDIAWLGARFPKAHFTVRSNSRDIQAEACARGAGMAVLPVALGELHDLTRAPGVTPPARDVWLGYHRDLRRLSRLRALIDYMADELPKAL